MTNQELLATPRDQLNHADRQRQHTLLLASLEQSCPACQSLINVFAAAGSNINDYEFGKPQDTFVCSHCQAHLEYVVPIIGLGSPWHWRLQQQWLGEQLKKAQAWDNLHKEEP